MDVNLKDVGKKFFQQVTSVGLPHGRPKVPKSALAAAALAERVMATPPHEKLALTEPPSEYSSKPDMAAAAGARPRGHKPEELDANFYEKDFDPILALLQELPSEGPDSGYFRERVKKRMDQLDVVNEHLSKQVMRHHDEMVQGMSLVGELERDLQVAKIISKNGRRSLSSAMKEVNSDLVVTANVKRKQILLDMLPILLRMQSITDIKARLQGTIDEGNYAKALRMCSECLVVIDACKELTAIQDMTDSIEDALKITVEKVDAALMEACKSFDTKAYAKVVDAYAVMDDPTTLSDKIQTYFAQHIVSITHDVLKSYVFLPDPNQEPEDPASIAKKARLPYNDLSAQLTEPQFRSCLQKTLEVLYDLLCTYQQMITWQHPKLVEQADGRPSLLNGKGHRRQGSAGTLSPPREHPSSPPSDPERQNRGKEASTSQSSGHLDDLHSGRPDSPSRHGSILGENSTLAKRSGSAGSLEEANGVTDADGHAALPAVTGGVPNQLRRQTTEGVRKALERGRKTVWELAARRVAALLSADAVCSSTPHHFLQSLDWTNKFILAGEAFSGTEAHGLRARVSKQSEKYFKTFHRQNLEVLRMVLEKEQWNRLPQSALKAVSLAGLTGGGGQAPPAPGSFSTDHSKTDSPPHGNATASEAGGNPAENGHVRTFAEWMVAGNPFAVIRRDGSIGGAQLERSAAAALTPRLSNGDAAVSSQHASAAPGAASPAHTDDEDEDVNEELLADYIDEDSQRPSARAARRSSGPGKPGRRISDDGEEGPCLTGSSISVLRYMDKYARLMQILQPISVEVFKGMCQLFELYIFTLFRLFGQREAFQTQKAGESSSLLTPRLRSTLVRIAQGLEEFRSKTAAASASSAAAAAVAAVTSGAPGSLLADLAAAPTGTKFSLQERVVAVESVLFLAEQFRRSRGRFQALLPQSSAGTTEHFYARTIDAVPDLREHIYKTLARLLLNVQAYTDKIANARWELKELGMEHNAHVDQILSDYRQLTIKIPQAKVSKEVQELLFEYATDGIGEALVEGFSRVKRCTNEGRALMSLDLQVLLNGLQNLSPTKTKPNMQIVDNYIKAFYVPETEFLHWARTHPEYSKAQIVAIVNLVATMNNWKRKTRVDLVEKIESGELG